jgi:hypothetical protein
MMIYIMSVDILIAKSKVGTKVTARAEFERNHRRVILLETAKGGAPVEWWPLVPQVIIDRTDQWPSQPPATFYSTQDLWNEINFGLMLPGNIGISVDNIHHAINILTYLDWKLVRFQRVPNTFEPPELPIYLQPDEPIRNVPYFTYGEFIRNQTYDFEYVEDIDQMVVYESPDQKRRYVLCGEYHERAIFPCITGPAAIIGNVIKMMLYQSAQLGVVVDVFHENSAYPTPTFSSDFIAVEKLAEHPHRHHHVDFRGAIYPHLAYITDLIFAIHTCNRSLLFHMIKAYQNILTTPEADIKKFIQENKIRRQMNAVQDPTVAAALVAMETEIFASIRDKNWKTIGPTEAALVKIMDLYMLGRMFRQFQDGSQPGAVIAITGGEHTENYIKFFDQIGYHKILQSARESYNSAKVPPMLNPIFPRSLTTSLPRVGGFSVPRFFLPAICQTEVKQRENKIREILGRDSLLAQPFTKMPDMDQKVRDWRVKALHTTQITQMKSLAKAVGIVGISHYSLREIEKLRAQILVALSDE